MSKNVVIIGAGEIGLSLGRILRTKDLAVRFWDKNSKTIEALGGEEQGLPEIIPSAGVIFLCVPSWSVREALIYITPYLNKQTILVAVSKGIEVGTLKTIDQIISSQLPKSQPWALLSGMMLAEEIREGLFGGAVVASNKSSTSQEIINLFSSTNLYLEKTNDLHGAALCGVLKNVYSLVLGISYGLNLGENARGFLAVKSLTEMKKIISLLGGKQETVLGLAGLGDFIATGLSNFSKNHQAGIALTKNKIPPIQSEGLNSLSSLIILLGTKYKKFPLLCSLYEIVQGNLDTEEGFKKILYGTNRK